MTPSDKSYRTISLTQGQHALVSIEDYIWLSQWKWFAIWNRNSKSFYAARRGKNEHGKTITIRMHREILGLPRCGASCRTMVADHRNRNTLDNTRDNLRVATSGQNRINQRARSDNSSGYLGVTKHPSGKWQAQITVNRKHRSLGLYVDAAAAHAAYRMEAERIHGEFTALGSIEEKASLLQE